MNRLLENNLEGEIKFLNDKKVSFKKFLKASFLQAQSPFFIDDKVIFENQEAVIKKIIILESGELEYILQAEGKEFTASPDNLQKIPENES